MSEAVIGSLNGESIILLRVDFHFVVFVFQTGQGGLRIVYGGVAFAFVLVVVPVVDHVDLFVPFSILQVFCN